MAAAPAPTGPDAATLAEGYFALGAWRIGMPREEALKLFDEAVAVEGDRVYRGTAHTLFAQDLPAELTFDGGRLSSVKLEVYQGSDFEAGVQRMQSTLLYLNDHFGGANFEGGLKTWQDPKGDLVRMALRQTIDQMEYGARAVDEKEARKKRKSAAPTHTAFEMVMNFTTEMTNDRSYLLGEFRYLSNLGQTTVNLYEDREFVESRIPDAMVNLFRAKGERPARAAPASP